MHTAAARAPVLGWALAMLVATATAWADSAATPPLPTLALDPAPQPSLWSGLYVGTEVFAMSRKGGTGGVGGDAYAGYDHEFANALVLGVQGGAGYSPGWSGGGRSKGFDFAETDIRLGYDMGRLMPFVSAGVALARPHFGPGEGFQGSESFNTLTNGPGDLQATTRVGVGAVYALTNSLSVGVAVSAVNGRGPLVP